MRIVDALIEVLKEHDSLTYKEAYKKILEKNLYSFGAKDPELAVNAKLRSHCVGLDFPSASPVKYFTIVGQKGTRNLYALIEKRKVEESKESKQEIKRNDDVTQTTEDKLPEEKIDMAYLSYKNNLKRQILEHVSECHSSFFEQLVVDMLLEMGYGTDAFSGKVIGRSHDGGIDGVIYEDKLGLSKIYIQAKRYDKENNITRPMIQSFVGAMQNVQKGVFITTSAFTKEAKAYAESQQQKNLKLIDGDMLTELMIKFGIGLEKVHIYTVYKINEDFFE